jgi:urease accessory protein
MSRETVRDPASGRACDRTDGLVNDPASGRACDRAHLTFEARSKSRLLLTLEDGTRAALVLERGRVLHGGDVVVTQDGSDRVRTEDGREIEIIAAEEALLEACSSDALLLTRAAYHLGNRHVAVQVMPGCLRFLNDHVLGEMVSKLGLQVQAVQAAFEPEGGAYGRHHAHGSQVPLIQPKIHEFLP